MYISVRVVAGAKQERIETLPKGRLKVWVKAPAKQNLANIRVCELVAEHLQVSLAHTRLISGHTSPSKMFSIDEPV